MRLDLKLGFDCNNNCIFCAQAHKIGNLGTEKVKEILSYNFPKCDDVVFTGGEPTIREDFVEIIKHAKKIGYKNIQVQSNGRKFSNLKYCEEIINAGITKFSIAIHGHNEKIHDSLTRVKGSFIETKKGISNLIELGQYVATNTVIVKINYQFIPEIADLLGLLYPNQSQFAFVHAIGHAIKFFDVVVPKMSKVVPYVEKGIEIILNHKIEPRIEAIPPCLIEKYEQYLTEKYIPKIKITDVEEVIENWGDIRVNKAKKKFVKCRDCKYNLCCEGTWKEYPEKFGSEEFVPLSPQMNEVVIQLTNKCNLSCDFCFDVDNCSKQHELEKKDVIKILNEVKGKTNAIRFTGGEPLLRKDLGEILHYSKKQGFYNILNTNGTLLTKENMIILDNVDDLLISFHNISSKEDKSKLYKLINNYKPKIFLRSCTILTKENIVQMEEFYSFMQFQPIKDWFLLRQIPNKKTPEPISKKDSKIIIDKIFELNKKYRIKPIIANSLPFCLNEKVQNVCVGGKNDSGHTRIYVNSYGEILTDYFSMKKLGNIDETDKINKAWLGNYMKGIRNLDYVIKKCKVCRHLVACKGGLSTKGYVDYLI